MIPDVSLGENSRIKIVGTDLLVQTGTVTENPAEVATGCNMTGGFTTRTRGLYNLEVQAKAQWTPAENPFTNPPQLQPGQDAEDVRVYPDIVNNPDDYYDLPLAYVVSATCEIVATEQGVISYSLNFKNQGEYGTPAYPIT